MLATALIGYTVLMLGLGYASRRRQGTAGFFNGGHRLPGWSTFVLVTALWTSSCIVVEIDTGYEVGISAVWFGISVALLSISVALLMPFFRKRGYTSNSDLLGKGFGKSVQRLSGVIIGVTFPIFAMSNALFAALFFRALWGWPLAFSLGLTTIVLIIYIQFAGLVSLAATQGVNLAVMLGALGLTAALVHTQLSSAGSRLVPATLVASLHNWSGVGLATILVWFGMNVLNVFSAQAEFQMLAAARSPRQARQVVWLSTGVLLAVTGVSTWIGLQMRLHAAPQISGGLSQLAYLIVTRAHSWEIPLIGVGIWAMALSWCGPLLFSGAMSLGKDVVSVRVPMRWTQWALALEGAAMMAFTLWRPGETAWWRVFGLTLRNAGIVGPTVALILWGEELSGSFVVAAMLSGVGVGLALNAATGFSPTHFVGDINPMWAAQAATFLVLALGRWLQTKPWTHAAAWVLATVTVTAYSVSAPWVPPAFRGIALLLTSCLAFGLTWLLTRQLAAGQEGTACLAQGTQESSK